MLDEKRRYKLLFYMQTKNILKAAKKRMGNQQIQAAHHGCQTTKIRKEEDSNIPPTHQLKLN